MRQSGADPQVGSIVDRSIGCRDVGQSGPVVARTRKAGRATETEREDIGVRGDCHRSIPVVERFSKLSEPPQELARAASVRASIRRIRSSRGDRVRA